MSTAVTVGGLVMEPQAAVLVVKTLTIKNYAVLTRVLGPGSLTLASGSTSLMAPEPSTITTLETIQVINRGTLTVGGAGGTGED